MRWVRTDVLPVPAPATTSIGPWTCSMAWRCRSSGTNDAARLLDLEDGIAAQDITQPGCANYSMWVREDLDKLGNCDGRGRDRGSFSAKNAGAEGCRYPSIFV